MTIRYKLQVQFGKAYVDEFSRKELDSILRFACVWCGSRAQLVLDYFEEVKHSFSDIF